MTIRHSYKKQSTSNIYCAITLLAAKSKNLAFKPYSHSLASCICLMHYSQNLIEVFCLFTSDHITLMPLHTVRWQIIVLFFEKEMQLPAHVIRRCSQDPSLIFWMTENAWRLRSKQTKLKSKLKESHPLVLLPLVLLPADPFRKRF